MAKWLSLILVLATSHCRSTQALDSQVLQVDASLDNQELQSQFHDVTHRVDPQDQHLRVASFSADEADRYYEAVIRNTVSRTGNPDASRYDPTGAIGFCFGRAMAAHLTAERWAAVDDSGNAVRKSLAPDSIKKLFIIGDMRSNPTVPEWRFHVTTIIKQHDAAGEVSWVAIDPILTGFGRRVVPLEEWVRIIRRQWDNWQRDSAGNRIAMTELYITTTNAVLPDISVMYPDGSELGDRIINIDIAFDPVARGLPASEILPSAFELDAQRTQEYFLSYDEAIPEQRFSFVSLNITYNPGEPDEGVHSYDYNHYFEHLLTYFAQASNDQLADPPRTWPTDWPPKTFNPVPEPGPRGQEPTGSQLLTPRDAKPKENPMGSMRFEFLR